MSTSPIWPSIAARTRPHERIPPPFAADIRNAKSVLIATSAPSPALFDFLFKHLLPRLPGASCQILLGINPVLGTVGLANGLRELLARSGNPVDSTAPPTLDVRLLTPGRIGGARPRFELAIITDDKAGTSVSIGSSPGFGLDTATAGDLNLWTPLEPSLCNGLRDFALTLWSLAVPLRPALCEVPDLIPPSGNEEGARLWQSYELEVSRTTDLPVDLADAQKPAPPALTIEDIPVKEDGSLDEQALVAENASRGEATELKAVLDAAVPAVPPLQITLAAAFASGSLMAVGKQAKPLAVPVPPSMFGQSAETKVGTAKQTQKFSIELFGDPKTRSQIEKLRTGTNDLLKRFSFSFGHARYWVPDSARKALDAAVQALGDRAKLEFSAALSGDPGKFLEGRRGAIQSDLTALYGKLVPGGTLPSRSVDEVIALLKQRIDAIEGGNFVPDLSASRVTFDTRTAGEKSHWGDALTLVRAIVRQPRELLSDRYPESAVKDTNLTVPGFLKVMNVLNDELVNAVTDDNWKSTWVAREAEAQLNWLDQLEASEPDPQVELEQLLSIAAVTVK